MGVDDTGSPASHTLHKEGLLFFLHRSTADGRGHPASEQMGSTSPLFGKETSLDLQLWIDSVLFEMLPSSQDRPAGSTLGLGGNMTLLAPRRTLHVACCDIAGWTAAI